MVRRQHVEGGAGEGTDLVGVAEEVVASRHHRVDRREGCMGTVIVQGERHEALACELEGPAALVAVQPAGLVRNQQAGQRAIGRVGKGDRPHQLQTSGGVRHLCCLH